MPKIFSWYYLGVYAIWELKELRLRCSTSHFSRFTLSCHDWSQSLTARIPCSKAWHCSMVVASPFNFESSAYSWILECSSPSDTLLINKINKSGPRIVLWGMPLIAVEVANLDSSTFTQKHRPIRKLESHLCKLPHTQFFIIFIAIFRVKESQTSPPDLMTSHPAYDVCQALVHSHSNTSERETHAKILR